MALQIVYINPNSLDMVSLQPTMIDSGDFDTISIHRGSSCDIQSDSVKSDLFIRGFISLLPLGLPLFLISFEMIGRMSKPLFSETSETVFAILRTFHSPLLDLSLGFVQQPHQECFRGLLMILEASTSMVYRINLILCRYYNLDLFPDFDRCSL